MCLLWFHHQQLPCWLSSWKIPKNNRVSFDGNFDEWTKCHESSSHLSGDPSWLPTLHPIGADVTSLGPVLASGAFCLQGAQFLTYQCWHGSITIKASFRAFAITWGMSEETQLWLYNAAAEHRSSNCTSEFDKVFIRELLPPAWIDPAMPITKFLDAPMHLLFLGLTKNCIELIEECLTSNGLNASFAVFSSKTLEEIGMLGLQWLLAMRYAVASLTHGSWESKQYIAFLQLFLVVHIGIIGLINGSKKCTVSEVKIVLQLVESCFCCISLIMQRTVNNDLIRQCNN